MVYPNTTGQKSPRVHPISTPTIWGRRNMFTFSSGVRVLPKRGTGALKSKQNQGGAVTYVYNRIASCKWPRSCFGFVRFHRDQFLHSESMELELKTIPSGRTGGILVKIWGRFWFLVFIWSSQPIKKVQESIPFRCWPLGG